VYTSYYQSAWHSEITKKISDESCYDVNRWTELALAGGRDEEAETEKVVHYALVIKNRYGSRSEKNRYTDILKVFVHIILTSKDSKERADASSK